MDTILVASQPLLLRRARSRWGSSFHPLCEAALRLRIEGMLNPDACRFPPIPRMPSELVCEIAKWSFWLGASLLLVAMPLASNLIWTCWHGFLRVQGPSFERGKADEQKTNKGHSRSFESSAARGSKEMSRLRRDVKCHRTAHFLPLATVPPFTQRHIRIYVHKHTKEAARHRGSKSSNRSGTLRLTCH